VNRRRFLNSIAALSGVAYSFTARKLTAGFAGAGNLAANREDGKSRVVIAHRSDLRASARQMSGDAIQKLLDTTLENLLQAKSLALWTSLFSPNDVVGLKVNCLAGKGLSTSMELVQAVIERLLEIGIEKQHIIVWDRMSSDLERAGHQIYYGRNRTQCYGNDRSGYTNEIYEYASIGSHLSRIVTQECTAIINLPILKDHGIVGVSAALKNFFGAIHNPNKYHDSVGDPYVADVNMLADIRKKTRLTICDALTPQYEGGPPYMPQWTWRMDSLVAATDMVALDQIAWQIIEEKRKEAGLMSLKEAGREPSYIATAADPDHRLGNNDPKKIELIQV